LLEKDKRAVTCIELLASSPGLEPGAAA